MSGCVCGAYRYLHIRRCEQVAAETQFSFSVPTALYALYQDLEPRWRGGGMAMLKEHGWVREGCPGSAPKETGSASRV